MIRVNLLHSVTERNSGATVAVERKMSSPATRLLVMSIVIVIMFAGLTGWHVISANSAKANAEQELAEQQKIASELEAVLKEQQELENKIKNIDVRIEAIKKLRSTQAGPKAVLDSILERILSSPGIFLQSIEQTGEQLIIKGDSPDEQAVAQFGRSLEFSGGLFTNLSIETQRKEVAAEQVAGDGAPPKLETVNFIIRCAYTPSKAGSNSDGTIQANGGANTPPAGGQTPPQVAQNK